jgi:hypothetical protein
MSQFLSQDRETPRNAHVRSIGTQAEYLIFGLQLFLTANFVRFEVCTAVTMKDVVLWDIKPSPYLTGDTLRLRYSVQPVNAM